MSDRAATKAPTDELARERRKRLAFEKFVRDELEFLREQSRRTNEALDLILKRMQLDDEED
jgi:hypothetical protein